MVTQHTTMIPAFTALENVILGSEPAGTARIIDKAAAARILRSSPKNSDLG